MYHKFAVLFMKYLFLTFCILFCAGCSHSTHKEEFEHIETLIQQEDTTALSALDSIGKRKEGFSKADKMRYELLLADAHNKFYISLAQDTIMQEVADYYSSHGNNNEKINAYYLLGSVYRDKGNTPQALETYHQAVEMADTTREDVNYALLCRIYAQIADLFYKQRAPQLELKMWGKAIKYAKIAKDTMAAINYLVYSGSAYHMMGKKDKSVEIAQDAYLQYQKHGCFNEAASCVTIFIEDELSKGKYKEAKKHIDEYRTKSGAFDEKGEIAEGREIFYYYVGKYYEDISKNDSALFYYRKLLQHPNDIINMESGYKGLMSVFQKIQQPDSMVKYAQLFANSNDSANFLHSATEITHTEALYNYKESQLLAIAKTKENNRLLTIIYTAVFFAYLLATIGYIYYKKKSAQRKRCQMDDNEKYSSILYRYSQLKEDMQTLQSDIDIYRKKKEKEINELYILLSTYQESPIESDEWDIKQALISHQAVRQLRDAAVHAITPSEKQWDALEAIISEHESDFYQYITAKEHKLTRQEIRTAFLIRLFFIPLEVATLLNVSKQRMTNIRSSINKKLFNESGTKNIEQNIKRI